MDFLTREQYHQKKGDKKILWKEDCPFCQKENEVARIVWEWKYWYVLHNIAPYSGDHRHIMAVPYEHIIYSKDLKKHHFEELSKVHQAVESFFWKNQYFSFTRETLANRSVEHLHIHFLAGKLQWKFLRKMLELQGFPITQNLEIN